MATLPLSQGFVAIIDDADFDWLNQWKWHATVKGRHKKLAYAARNERSSGTARLVYLHRVIAGASLDQKVDHINNDPLDNRRSNLRICSQQQNMWNTRYDAGRVGFRGVDPMPNGRFRARLKLASGSTHIGCFDTAEEAASAYDRRAREERGEFAKTNFELGPDGQERAAG